MYLATAPKSDSVKAAMGRARRIVEETPAATVPPHLRSTGGRLVSSLVDGRAPGYRDPHAGREHLIAQQYLPDEALGRVIYAPTRQGKEAEIADRLAGWDRRLRRPPRGLAPGG